ncbi:D-alanine--poly(phosphoribitol) ligase subunit 1 [Streptomyces sp. B3I7]|uniref:amino acid adenylation domain-containing protein n=1 Tax=Streptomyces sp. B3I7 TaxID=3042269 RepID=UPI00278AFFAE|nr:amino acid adenylation domain-containing protein [Streptomyces sp. B3I7]MDQ0808643.1 D-alanine--poly(phosphoribitol) ligase subunit 1 [Streptomyces sp. B3I7]
MNSQVPLTRHTADPDPRSRPELPMAPGAVTRARELALRNPVALDTTTALLDHVIRHARVRPDACAVLDGERTLTYGLLLARVASARDALHARGVRAGDLVAAVGPRSAHTPVVFLALESLGASYVPIDMSWPENRVRDVLDRSKPVLLLDYSGRTASAACAAADAEGLGTLSLPTEGRPGPVDQHPHGDRSGEIRYTIFTSGTTGRPKGATIEHQGLLNHLWSKTADLSLGPEDAVAFSAPLVFDISIWQMLCPLLVGGRVVVIDDAAMRMPRWLLGALDTADVTVVELVPTVVGRMLEETRRAKGPALPKLRWLLSTGEELYPALAEQVLDMLPHVTLVNAYGPAECSDDVSLHTVTRADLGRPRLPVGTPVANCTLQVLRRGDDGTWQPAEPGESGELFVGGTCVGSGYLHDAATTERAFFRDPFDPDSSTGRIYRTGDLARVEDGLLYYLGRSDRQVKVGGVRMELDEIEAVLSRHPAVEQCAVTVFDQDVVSELVAHYTLRTEVLQQELRLALGAALPPVMVPRRWQRWDALPLSRNGKIDYRSLTAAMSTTRKEAL